jgi:hypothetical protein
LKFFILIFLIRPVPTSNPPRHILRLPMIHLDPSCAYSYPLVLTRAYSNQDLCLPGYTPLYPRYACYPCMAARHGRRSCMAAVASLGGGGATLLVALLGWEFFVFFFVKLQKKRPMPTPLTHPYRPLTHLSRPVRVLSAGI